MPTRSDRTAVWTIDRLKDALPDVPVRLGNGVQHGQVSGRYDRFATVTVSCPCSQRQQPSWTIRLEVAWSTLVRVLNTGSAVGA